MAKQARFGCWRWLCLLVVVAQVAQAADQSVEARLRRDLTFLASDECEGRGPTTKGINLAADYIANEFKKSGLKPGGEEGSYFQSFTIACAHLKSPNYVRLHGPQGQEIELSMGRHFTVLGLSKSGKVTAPVVFAGYGVTSTNKEMSYDDYAGIDVAGKVVILLRDAPRSANAYASFDGRRRRQHASFTQKLTNAQQHDAAAVIFVNDHDTANDGDDLLNFAYLATARTNSNLPALQVRRAVLDALLESSAALSLAQVEQDIDRQVQPRSFPLSGWTATLEVHVEQGTLPLKNVVGVLEGSGDLASETVVIGAHYDHLGYGGGGSLAGTKKMAIHHGADDNGSGTTSILELARRFADRKNRSGRRLVFMTFSGEELGLLGSAHYCKNPLFPLAGTVAMVNLDMVGRLTSNPETKKEKLLIEGSGTAKTFDALLNRLNEKYDFQMSKKASGFGPSDHASFYSKEIPVIFYWTGLHSDYHRPSDTSDKINIRGMAKIVDLAEETIDYLAQVAERPQYVKVGNPMGMGIGTGAGPTLGVQPDYSDEMEGLLITAVTDGRPAAKAGLKGNDRIVELDGKPVKNITGYMALMRSYKEGDTIEVGIIRDGRKTALKVKLE